MGEPSGDGTSGVSGAGEVDATSAAGYRLRLPGAQEVVEALRSSLFTQEEERTFALALEVRDQLREALPFYRDPSVANRMALAEWETCPGGLEHRWHVLLAAFVSHEFEDAGLPAPGWTRAPRLAEAWVLDTPRLTDAQVREQTPKWLSERNLFVATKDLATL